MTHWKKRLIAVGAAVFVLSLYNVCTISTINRAAQLSREPITEIEISKDPPDGGSTFTQDPQKIAEILSALGPQTLCFQPLLTILYPIIIDSPSSLKYNFPSVDYNISFNSGNTRVPYMGTYRTLSVGKEGMLSFIGGPYGIPKSGIASYHFCQPLNRTKVEQIIAKFYQELNTAKDES